MDSTIHKLIFTLAFWPSISSLWLIYQETSQLKFIDDLTKKGQPVSFTALLVITIFVLSYIRSKVAIIASNKGLYFNRSGKLTVSGSNKNVGLISKRKTEYSKRLTKSVLGRLLCKKDVFVSMVFELFLKKTPTHTRKCLTRCNYPLFFESSLFSHSRPY